MWYNLFTKMNFFKKVFVNKNEICYQYLLNQNIKKFYKINSEYFFYNIYNRKENVKSTV